jgi:hypothetical protein
MLLALLIAVSISIALVAWSGWRLVTGYPPAALPNGVLNRCEQALVAAVADALFPPGGPIPLSGTEADILPYFDGYVRRSLPRQRLLMRLLLIFTEYSPLLFGPKRRRFTRLSQGERLDYLERCSVSNVYFRRIAFLSFRTLMTMAYMAHPEVERAMRICADCDPFRMGPPVTESGVRAKAGVAVARQVG